jgi:Na+-driven multidrug efflux pump
MKKNKINLIEDPVAPTILKMVGGMLFGFVAMSAFNAVDTYFVGQLGGLELAAMSFTFPVVMIIQSISMGLGIGISSVVSRAKLGGRKIKTNNKRCSVLQCSLYYLGRACFCLLFIYSNTNNFVIQQ